MSDDRVRYRSFLLRLWCDDQPSGMVWRSMLEETMTGEQIRFDDVAELVAFLNRAHAPTHQTETTESTTTTKETP